MLAAALSGSAVLRLHSGEHPQPSGGSLKAERPLTPLLAAEQNEEAS